MKIKYSHEEAERIPIDLEAWKLLSVPGLELILIHIPTGRNMEEHPNPLEVIFHVTHGMGILRVDGQNLTMTTGDTARITAGKSRAWQNTGQETLSILAIKRND
jgi:quercetin dioxygenase-like cupin family protein